MKFQERLQNTHSLPLFIARARQNATEREREREVLDVDLRCVQLFVTYLFNTVSKFPVKDKKNNRIDSTVKYIGSSH